MRKEKPSGDIIAGGPVFADGSYSGSVVEHEFHAALNRFITGAGGFEFEGIGTAAPDLGLGTVAPGNRTADLVALVVAGGDAVFQLSGVIAEAVAVFKVHGAVIAQGDILRVAVHIDFDIAGHSREIAVIRGEDERVGAALVERVAGTAALPVAIAREILFVDRVVSLYVVVQLVDQVIQRIVVIRVDRFGGQADPAVGRGGGVAVFDIDGVALIGRGVDGIFVGRCGRGGDSVGLDRLASRIFHSRLAVADIDRFDRGFIPNHHIGGCVDGQCGNAAVDIDLVRGIDGHFGGSAVHCDRDCAVEALVDGQRIHGTADRKGGLLRQVDRLAVAVCVNKADDKILVRIGFEREIC